MIPPGFRVCALLLEDQTRSRVFVKYSFLLKVFQPIVTISVFVSVYPVIRNILAIAAVFVANMWRQYLFGSKVRLIPLASRHAQKTDLVKIRSDLETLPFH